MGELIGKPFQPGHEKLGGRKKGSRNKLSTDFIAALADDFADSGPEAIRIMRIEKPSEYARVIASILPKEFEINDNRLKDIPDDQLDAFIAHALGQSDLSGDTEGGKDETADRKPPRLLQAVPKAE